MKIDSLREMASDLVPVAGTRALERWHAAGVRLVDPETTYVQRSMLATIRIGAGSVIFPNVYLLGKISIGKRCVILPNLILCNVRVGDGSQLGRPQYVDTVIGSGVRVGQFAEIVRSRIGDNSAAQHFGYLGDTRIGRGVNVGAGTVTANYDGKNKNRTIIRSGAFTGVNASIVAPVVVGSRAYIGAGATIRKDVPRDAIVVGLDRVIGRRPRRTKEK